MKNKYITVGDIIYKVIQSISGWDIHEYKVKSIEDAYNNAWNIGVKREGKEYQTIKYIYNSDHISEDIWFRDRKNAILNCISRNETKSHNLKRDLKLLESHIDSLKKEIKIK